MGWVLDNTYHIRSCFFLNFQFKLIQCFKSKYLQEGNGKHAEEDDDVEKAQDNGEAEEDDVEKDDEEPAEESPEEPEVQEVTNGTHAASPKKSPVKVSPLKKKIAETGDKADEPETKKLRRSLVRNFEFVASLDLCSFSILCPCLFSGQSWTRSR